MKILLKCSLLSVLLVTLLFSCSEERIVSSTEDNYSIDLSLSLETDWPMANAILERVNEHRDSIGLPHFAIDQTYASAYAVDHTKYMIDVGEINHDDLNLRTAALINKGANFVGENVAQGYSNAEDLVLAWLSSASHRDILEGNYTHVGFGILKNDAGVYYFTLLAYQ